MIAFAIRAMRGVAYRTLMHMAEDIRAMPAFTVIGLPTTRPIDLQGYGLGRVAGSADRSNARNLTLLQSMIAKERK